MVEKDENAQMHFRGGGGLIRDTPYELVFPELGSFLSIGRQFRKKIFCFYHFALIAKEIAVFSQFLPIGGLFL